MKGGVFSGVVNEMVKEGKKRASQLLLSFRSGSSRTKFNHTITRSVSVTFSVGISVNVLCFLKSVTFTLYVLLRRMSCMILMSLLD